MIALSDSGMQQMKTELLDMVQRADNPFDIIARLAKQLEDASAEPGYADYVQGQIRAIYGLALQEKKPLADELNDVRNRLARIEKARENPEFTEEERIRMGFAIDRHKKNIERLQFLLRQAEAQGIGKR